MSSFICPVCGGKLFLNGKSLLCKKKHTYDIAKSGYTNLFLTQQTKEKRHGDDKLMVHCRQAFLEKGYYNLLLEKICEMTEKYVKSNQNALDCGCGECWYTANIYEFLKNKHINTSMFAIDISKDALAAGAKRNQEIELAVASVFHLPVASEYCDMVFSVFAPFSVEEFTRVLKKNGILIKVIPLEKHLMSLKKAVYDKPYENEVELSEIKGFKLLEKREIHDTIHLSCNEDVLNLFTMTPYYYKTGADDQKKLQRLSELTTEIEFGIFVYKKI